MRFADIRARKGNHNGKMRARARPTDGIRPPYLIDKSSAHVLTQAILNHAPRTPDMTFPWVTATAVASLLIWKGAGIADAKPIFFFSLAFGIVRTLVDFIKHRRTWAKYVKYTLL
jgi:hypothetical protein